MTASDRLRHRYKTEMEGTRKLLALVPDDRMDYRPHPRSMTMGRLTGHIAELSHWLREVVLTDSFEFRPGGKPVFTPFAATSNAELMDRFDAEVAAATAALEGLHDDALDTIWTATRDGNVMIAGPRWEMLERFNLGHIGHHRGQLSVYLRLNEIPFPGIYGPSNDDHPPAPKPAS